MQDFRVALAQVKSPVGAFAQNVEKHQEYARQAAAAGAHVVCFPELSLSGYPTGDAIPYELAQPLDGELARAAAAIASHAGLVVMAGLLERDPSGVVYNTQIVASPAGLVGAYRKTHVPSSEIVRFYHGDDLPIFRLERATVGILICYDSHFPEASATLALRGAEVLFLPHASTGGGSGESYAEKRDRWLRYMPARAYDNGVYVVVVNQVGHNDMTEFPGVTMALDPWGKLIAEARPGDEDLLVVDLSAEGLRERRRSAESFYLHFRRPELYGEVIRPSRGRLESA